MADSVDRVFSHALNTVNKIRTGSEKPPSAIRLKLYGLYKQSMEGDVEGIMDRPEGETEDAQRAREKWEAWKQQTGLSRTEAKRQYITTLIDTMHKYASRSPDARELVAELEFVWDQVKSNVPSSSSSSPVQTAGNLQGHDNPLASYASLGMSQDPRQFRHKSTDQQEEEVPMRLLSPLSQSEEEELEENAEEEFVDAQDSQYDNARSPENVARETTAPSRPRGSTPQGPPASDQRWRKRVEQALVKMTAEVAALREQLESRRVVNRRQPFFKWILRLCWFVVKHITVNVVILGIVLLWMRRKKDRRLEGAIRVLLGDAVAQVQKVGAAQMVNIGRITKPKPASKPT